MFLGRIIEHLLIKSPAEMSALTLGAFKIQNSSIIYCNIIIIKGSYYSLIRDKRRLAILKTIIF